MRKNKGFTLIELMIVIAIIAIIAAIAIPNLLQSRIRANESNAVSQTRNYVAAASIYQARGSGALGENRGGLDDGTNDNARGYTMDYRFLYYGVPIVGDEDGAPALGTSLLRLISQTHADASINTGSVGPLTGNQSPAAPVAFNGYRFGEPATVPDLADGATESTWYDLGYAHIAAPEDSDRTGSRTFFVDDNGTVQYLLLQPGQKLDDNKAVTTPLDGNDNWQTI